MRVVALLVVLGWSVAPSAGMAQPLSFADARKTIRTASISAPQPCPYLPDDTCFCVETNIQNLSGGEVEISKIRLGSKIVEAILGGRQPARLQLDRLMRRLPVGWEEQRGGNVLGSRSRPHRERPIYR